MTEFFFSIQIFSPFFSLYFLSIFIEFALTSIYLLHIASCAWASFFMSFFSVLLAMMTRNWGIHSFVVLVASYLLYTRQNLLWVCLFKFWTFCVCYVEQGRQCFDCVSESTQCLKNTDIIFYRKTLLQLFAKRKNSMYLKLYTISNHN